jgi:hypothetical protein
VNDNRLSGALPSEIGLLRNMTRMQMQRNKFTGTIPHQYGYMQKIEQWLMEGNKLEGTIPYEVCDLTKMSLSQYIVDCKDERSGYGFECGGDINHCCTLCRNVN